MEQHAPLEVGFYGGTFTALPAPWPQRFVELAGQYKAKGVVSAIRCSTRPDAINEKDLRALASLGLDRVELGIQSFDSGVLSASRRGYDQATALGGCRLVRRCGLELGVHLMPGLPHSTAATFRDDVRFLTRLDVQTVRLHPTVVLAGTGLEKLYRKGVYSPPVPGRGHRTTGRRAPAPVAGQHPGHPHGRCPRGRLSEQHRGRSVARRPGSTGRLACTFPIFTAKAPPVECSGAQPGHALRPQTL